MSERHSACPAVPLHRKAFGTAVNVDGEVLLYTEAEMEAHGLACFRAGRQHTDAARLAAAVQSDEDAWADYRSGRAPRPKGPAATQHHRPPAKVRRASNKGK